MATVLGIHVPELGDNPQGEVCHSFVYRYLVAAGYINKKLIEQHDPMQNLMTKDADFLYSHGGKGLPARQGGKIMVTSGKIVIFRDPHGVLMHSMIALDSDNWIGANNTGCFGVAQGRTTISDVKSYPKGGHSFPGWKGDDNEWDLGSSGIDTVWFIDPPLLHHSS